MLLKTHMQEIARGSVAALISFGVGIASRFLFALILARLLGAEEIGTFFLALSVTTILSVMGRVGLDNTLLRFIGRIDVTKAPTEIHSVWKTASRITLTVSATATLVLLFSGQWIALNLFGDPKITSPLLILSFSILPLAMGTLYGQALKALKVTGKGTFVQYSGKNAVALFLLLPFLWLGLSPSQASAIYVAAAMTTMVLGMAIWKRRSPAVSQVVKPFPRRILLASSLPLLWVAGMNLIMNWTDTIMLGIWSNGTSVGIYNVGARTAQLVGFILIAVNSIAAPKFAALFAGNETQLLRQIAQQVSFLTSLVSFPVALLFIVFPGKVMLLFGPDFSAGASVLIILSVGQFINVSTGSVGYLLMMTGHEKEIRNTLLGAALLNVVLNVILIPSLGIIGAALASAASLSCQNFVNMWFVRKRLGFWTIPVARGSLV